MFHNETTNAQSSQSRHEERRAQRRQRALKGALVVFNGGLSTAEATVRDMSETGLRLRFGDGSAIPAHCEVAVKGGSPRRPAVIVWRTRNEAGLRFS